MNIAFSELKDIVSKMDNKTQREFLQRARVIVQEPKVERCEHCHQLPLIQWRGGRKYCTNACKQKAYRQRAKGVGK